MDHNRDRATSRPYEQICLVPFSIICVRDCRPWQGNKSIQGANSASIVRRLIAFELLPSAILSESYKGSACLRVRGLSFLSCLSSSHDMPSAYPADILYISVRLLAPCKSIFALPLESNLSVSVGSEQATADETGKRF